MGNTNRFTARRAGGWQYASTVHGKFGGTWRPARYVYAKHGGVWRGVYSVLSPSKTDAFYPGSGASASGTVDCGATANATGNIGPLSFLWARTGGAGHTCLNPTSATPTFRYNFSGVGPEQTSYAYSTWQCTISDGDTGATTVIGGVSVGSAWTNTIPAFSGRTDYITSSQSVATPSGANSLIVYIVGGGAQGGAGFNDGMGTEYFGGGASGAGQAVKTISGPSGSYSCTVGGAGFGSNQGGTSSVSGNGISASASGGYPGMSAGSGGWGDAQNSVGGASGGDANYSGNAGFAGFQGGGGGAAGNNGGPFNGNYYGYGGNGGGPLSGGNAGEQGIVVLVWSP